jgi:hypothetical protein
VRGISRYGRLAQGVRLMNMKDDDLVSAVALVVESAPDNGNGVTPVPDREPAEGGPDGTIDGS